jgi:hypothetical protein
MHVPTARELTAMLTGLGWNWGIYGSDPLFPILSQVKLELDTHPIIRLPVPSLCDAHELIMVVHNFDF